MNTKEFIKNCICLITDRFPSVKVSYEFEKHSCTHFLEINPSSIFRNNEDYKNLQDEIFDEFIELFPYESICFISDDSIVGIENIEFESVGANYYSNRLQIDSISMLFESIAHLIPVDNPSSEADSEFNIFQDIKVSNVWFTYNLLDYNLNSLSNKPSNIFNEDNRKTEITVDEESLYIMAA
jgi:hypothetical protein